MIILLKDVTIVYPGIYTTTTNPFSDIERYRTAIQYDGDLLINEAIVPRGEQNLYNASSNRSSTILPKSKDTSDFYQISEYINLARNCNIELDTLFKGMSVDMVVDTWSYRYDDNDGMGFSINEIHINPDDLLAKITQPSTGEVAPND